MNPIASAVDRLGADRVRSYPLLILVVTAVAYLAFEAAGAGLVDPSGRAIGADFSAFYAAGRLVLEGQAAAAYDLEALHARMTEVLGADVGRLPVHYPPPALLLFAVLGLMPYTVAVAVWLLASCFAVLVIAENGTPQVAGRRWLWASPAAILGVLNGQTGPGVGAFVTTAVARMEVSPRLAGLCAGLLVLKPTFLPLVATLLVARGAWRAAAWAMATASALCGVSVLLLGLAPWQAWLGDVALAQRILLEGGVSWSKMPTVTASLLNLGASPALAQAAQGVVIVAVVAWVVRLARGSNTPAFVLAAVLGTMLLTPFAFDYDLGMTLVAVAILADQALVTGSRAAAVGAAALWLLPGLLPLAASVYVPLGPIVLIGCLFVPIAGTDRRRARREVQTVA